MKTCETCQVIHGWKVTKTADINIPKSTYTELEHIETGAKYIHLANQNPENVFCVALQTIPTDSTGVAHILEHTVLTGSEKYPVRDPFFSMLKRSLQTFMNAFTSEDWTAYPFASPNKKDFYNLMELYLDAAFFPKLDKLNFSQEGWRYTFDGDNLRYDGVVYNEMKGSTSSVDRIMYDGIMEGLYAEAPYHYNTGGQPADIPKLTYEALKDFHALHYHPTNALFYSFGDASLEDNLLFVNKEVMSRFEKGQAVSVKKEKRWTEPKKFNLRYPISRAEDKDKHQVALAWLTAAITDNREIFALELLEDILLANQASPLRKILLESGLGSDLCDGCGYDSDMQESNFVLGLKDVSRKNIQKVYDLVEASLEDLVKNGLDKDLVESVIVSNETRKKNLINQPYPIGLQVFLDIVTPVLHGGDALEILEFDNLLANIKKSVEAGGYFESIIQKYLLDNKHKLKFVLEPDMDLAKEKEERINYELRIKNDELSDLEKVEIRKLSANLLALQDADEDLSVLPSLEISDIQRDIQKEVADKASTTSLRKYSRDTSGLVYFVGTSDLYSLDSDVLNSLSLYTYLFNKMSTSKYSVEELAKHIDKTTGGIATSAKAMRVHGDDSQSLLAMNLRSYALGENKAAMLELVEELMSRINLDDKERLKILTQSFYTQVQSNVVDMGHNLAAQMAQSVFSRSNQINESLQGLTQLKYLKTLVANDLVGLDKSFAQIKKVLKENLFARVALVGGKEDIESLSQQATGLIKSDITSQNDDLDGVDSLQLALTTNTQVSFTASAFRTVDIHHKDSAALMILNKFLARGFLHSEIREKGGAYGGFSRYDHLDGSWSFGSYRDPNITKTFEVFARARDYALNTFVSDTEVEELIIAVSSDIDKPATKRELAQQAYTRSLINLGDEVRQTFKNNLLQVKASDIKDVAEKYLLDSWEDYSNVVITSKDLVDRDRLGERGFEIGEI